MEIKSKKFCILILCIVFFEVIFCILAFPYWQAERLIGAIKREDTEKVRTMLQSGVDPNQMTLPPSRWWSLWEMAPDRPLSQACSTGNYEIVKLLIDHGATAEYIDRSDWSPLRCVLFRYDSDDIEIIKLLLENGADPEVVEADYNSIFAAADMYPHMMGGGPASWTYNEEVAQNITTIVKMLLADRSVDMRTEYDKTLLMVAARRGNLCLVQYLLESGCDPALTDYQGKTAADYAFDAGKEDVLHILNQTKLNAP